MINREVKKYLAGLWQEQKVPVPFCSENEIARKIKDILGKDEKYKQTKEDIAEAMAFYFMANCSNSNAGWKTYYGPMFVLRNKEGQTVECPSIRLINQQMLKYWAKRAKETKNPVLSSRYADLVVDFSLKILNKNADIDLFQTVIDANITICEKSLANPLDCKTKIKRALVLAVQTNDQLRIVKTKDTIIKLEKNIATDDKPGCWGFAFKWLLLDFSKKIILKDEEINELITEIEEKLKRVKKNPWLAENAVFLLAEYYANEKDEENLMRVLSVWEGSLKMNERLNSDALLTISIYERMQEIYRKYASRFAKSEKANKRLSQEIGQLDLDWNESLEKISIETKIEQKDIDIYLKIIFGEDKNDKLEVVMTKIAINYLPQEDVVKKELNDSFNKYPMQFLSPKQIISEDGMPIAKLSTLKEDYNSNFQNYASQHIVFDSPFLFFTMNELRRQFAKEKIIEHIEKSVFFESENRDYLKRAISAYWDRDYIVASHLFIPLIENGIREFIRICGGEVLKPNDLNGCDNVSLARLLKNDQIFKNVFSDMGHNVLFYLKLALTEKLGMNLRNDFAHGLSKEKFFGCQVSDRLFHILILLSMVRKKEK